MPLRASMTKVITRRGLVIAALAALAFQTAAGQSNESKAGAGTKPMAAGAASHRTCIEYLRSCQDSENCGGSRRPGSLVRCWRPAAARS